MTPIIAIVGRPNVGKSTLFNRLTRSRHALVANMPGLTRDRHYGEGRLGDRPFLVVDTGGFEPVAKMGILYEMAKQTKQAVAEADAVIFLVDGRQGLMTHDQTITGFLRKSHRTVLLVVNKAEGMRFSSVSAEFYELGLGDPYVISAAHGDGVVDLVNEVLDMIEKNAFSTLSSEHFSPPASEGASINLAIVGRPNVGKSTLVNTLLCEERMIAFDVPGTTRDTINIPFEWQKQHYLLMDTAGLRRRGKVFETIEKFSVVKTLKAISDAHVVLLLLDAQQDISEQDAHIAGFILEAGRALVVAVNKWDGLNKERRDQIKQEIDRKLGFLGFAQQHFVSALKSTGIAPMMASVNAAFFAATRTLSTPQLTRAVIAAVEHQPPRRCGLVRPKLRYAHQGGKNPPVVIIHGNALENIEASYQRYLERHLRDAFSLVGTPLQVVFKSGKNPYHAA